MFGTIYSFGVLHSYMLSRNYPSMVQRLATYHIFSHMFFVAAGMSMIIIPYRRLTGYWENGLRWKTPADKFTKFDATSKYEAATGWARFRVRGDN